MIAWLNAPEGEREQDGEREKGERGRRRKRRDMEVLTALVRENRAVMQKNKGKHDTIQS